MTCDDNTNRGDNEDHGTSHDDDLSDDGGPGSCGAGEDEDADGSDSDERDDTDEDNTEKEPEVNLATSWPKTFLVMFLELRCEPPSTIILLTTVD